MRLGLRSVRLSRVWFLTTHSKPSISISMRKLTATLCLTIAVLLGSVGIGVSADYPKGLTAYKNGDDANAQR